MLTANDQFTWDYAFASIATAFIFFCCCCCDLKKPAHIFFHWIYFDSFIRRSFLFVNFFSRLHDLFNKRLLKMCVCLHTRHISISPRFNQCRNPSIESRICSLILLLTMATATVLSFFVHIFAFLFLLWACVLYCRYGCLSFYLTTSLSSLNWRNAWH